MVSSPQLPDDVRRRIASQIADRSPRPSELSAPGAIAGLGESLRVALLSQEQIDKGKGPIAERVTETGQWHHQIYADGAASSFARSTEEATAPGLPADVVEVAESSIADDLRRTIDWVDENVEEDGEAEVLAVPSHFVTGLWLRGPNLDAVVVASAPVDVSGIELNQLIQSDRFLRILATMPPVAGLGLPDESSTPAEAGA